MTNRTYEPRVGESKLITSPSATGQWKVLIPLLTAVGAAIGFTALHLRGTSISPDGWGYWQAAVSLLHGKGYRYFSGHPIITWPPVYSLYLAACTALGGATVVTLVVSNSLLTIAGAVGWLWLLLRIGEGAGVRLTPKVLAAVGCYLALFLTCNEQYPLADNLKYALLPWLILATCRLCESRGSREIARWTALQVLAGTVLVLTHNNALAFIAAASATVVVFARLSVRLRLLLALSGSAIPMASWFAVRVLLDQQGSHAIGIGAGREAAAAYAKQLVAGIGELLTGGPTYLGAVAVAALTAVVVAGCLGGSLKRACRMIAFFTFVSLAATYALFNITWIDDSLAGRYLLFVPLSLVPMVLCWSALANRLTLLVAGAAVLFPLVLGTCFAFHHSRASEAQLGYPGYFVPLDGRISLEYRKGPPVRTADGVLLAPLAWEEQKGRHRGLRDR